VLKLPLRLLALPFNRELSKLRSEIRAYGEGSLEATTMVGSELRSIARALDEELPLMQARIEALERELEEIKRESEPSPHSPD
jgi:transposase